MAKDTSIWGDLDLKAVARDVESQTASLAEEVKQFSVAEEGQVSEETAIVTVESALPQPDNEAIARTAPDDTGAETAQVAPRVVAAAAARRRVSPRNKGTPTADPKHRPKLTTIEAPAHELSQTPVVPVDLDALEDENRRLKALLREALLMENARLNEMLSRFL